MKRLLTLVAIILTTALFATQGASNAHAQFLYVSHSGSDADPSCSTPTTACHTIDGAISKAFDGNTISCVDAGFFGYTTITKSITIDCLAGGGGENIQVLTINSPGKTVRLRNIAMNALGVNVSVIEIIAASNVYIENLFATAAGSGFSGIYDHRAGPGTLTISNSSFVNNTGVGIAIAPASGIIGATLDNVRSANNSFGLAVGP